MNLDMLISQPSDSEIVIGLFKEPFSKYKLILLALADIFSPLIAA